MEAWNQRVRSSGSDQNEASLRRWLGEQGISGYPQQLLIFERFGYPDYLASTPEELIEAQYQDRPAMRPILDAVVLAAMEMGAVSVQARKGYVTLVGPRRTFALVRAATRGRVDLGLRLEGVAPGGRLISAGSMPQGWATLKFELKDPGEVDDEVRAALARTYQANL